MSYTITLTNGTVFATIADGTINTSANPTVTLVGKNYAGYGAFLDTNFMRMLENSSNNTAPSAPITGQLWWNNTPNAGQLSIYMGSAWKNLASLVVASTTPSAATYSTTGDLWFDTVNQQVNIWTGSAWLLVGPQFSSGTGVTGAFANVITDSTSVTHQVIELVVDGNVVGIVSKDTVFTPQILIPGFANVNPGVQLANLVTGVGGNSVPSYWGQGNVGVSVTGNISANVIIGTNISAVANVIGGNVLTGGLISATGTITSAANITGGNVLTGGLISATGNITGNFILGNGSQLTGMYGNTNVANYLPTFSGTLQVGNIINANGNGIGNIGNGSAYFNTIFAKATSAQYADVAERFAADDIYEAGTVVELGGINEITRSTQELSDTVFGVISTQAAYLMNSGAGSDLTHPPVAMTGRVPVKCTGVVRKGDRLVGAGDGIARSAVPGEATAFNVIGRALADKLDSELGVVEAIVTIK